MGVVLVTVLVAAAFVWAAALPAPSEEETYSFEQDMEGWAAGGTDLYWGNCSAGASAIRPSVVAQGNCSVAWSVERTTELAREGAFSVRLSLENLNDAGKIWIERPFNVTPERTYRVHVSFAFASADFGSVNHWRIIAGALSERPTSADDLTSAYREDTGNGLDSPSGHVWLEKGYDSTVRSDSGGRLWVLVGVWGTWEGPRTYYVDVVRVSITTA